MTSEKQKQETANKPAETTPDLPVADPAYAEPDTFEPDTVESAQRSPS